MKLTFVKEEKDYVEVRLDGEDLGLVNMVAMELVNTNSAAFADASLDHPITANPVLRVRGKDAKKEIAKAAESIAKRIEAVMPADEKPKEASKKSKKKD